LLTEQLSECECDQKEKEHTITQQTEKENTAQIITLYMKISKY